MSATANFLRVELKQLEDVSNERHVRIGGIFFGENGVQSAYYYKYDVSHNGTEPPSDLLKELVETLKSYSSENRNFKVAFLTPNESYQRPTLILFGGAVNDILAITAKASVAIQFSAQIAINSTDGKRLLKIPIRPQRYLEELRRENFPTKFLLNSSFQLKQLLNEHPIVLMQSLDFDLSLDNWEFTLTLEGISMEIMANENADVCFGGVQAAFQLNDAIQLDDQFADFIIISADGTEFKCHKVFFTAHSDVFKAMLSKDMKEAVTGELLMEGLSNGSVKALLDFLYKFKIDEPKGDAEVALDLLKTSHMYGIKSLLKSMTPLFLSWPQSWKDDVEFALRLFCFSRKVETLECLRMKAVQVLKSKGPRVLMESECFKDLFMKEPEAAMELSASFCY